MKQPNAIKAIRTAARSAAKMTEKVMREFALKGVDTVDAEVKAWATETYGKMSAWDDASLAEFGTKEYTNYRQIKSRYNKALELDVPIFDEEGAFIFNAAMLKATEKAAKAVTESQEGEGGPNEPEAVTGDFIPAGNVAVTEGILNQLIMMIDGGQKEAVIDIMNEVDSYLIAMAEAKAA